jgi:hypothetical protein
MDSMNGPYVYDANESYATDCLTMGTAYPRYRRSAQPLLKCFWYMASSGISYTDTGIPRMCKIYRPTTLLLMSPLVMIL